jgi:predicted PolB exonuclease-like 3'-5' exonuclease
MIKIPLTKILFLDIETVGINYDYEMCVDTMPEISHQFDNYFDWFLKRFPEDKEFGEGSITKLKNYVFHKRTGLVPEFAKVVCVSAAFVTDKGEIKKQTFYGNDELVVLKDTQKLLDRCGKLDFFLCGHNLKNFDIPMLAKRMMINGLLPPSILPSYDTKPWEVKAIDTKEIWQYGSYTSIGSLDLLCTCMNVPSPKDGPVTGANVHNVYWTQNEKLKEIADYCEKDVEVLVDIIKKLKSLN